MLFRRQRRRIQPGGRLVQNCIVPCLLHIQKRNIGKKQQVVAHPRAHTPRNMRIQPIRMPPMLHVAFPVLMPGGTQDLLTYQRMALRIRRKEQKARRILKLVAKTICA